MIYGNPIGTNVDKTFIIQDADGNEFVGVLVDKEVIFTADANDIRIGKVAATQNGVVTGTKEIPAYVTQEGFKLIPNGEKVRITTYDYDYKKMQAIICAYNTDLVDSVSAERVAINDNVYLVQSSEVESVVTKKETELMIDFGITNETGAPYVLRYFMYKEIY